MARKSKTASVVTMQKPIADGEESVEIKLTEILTGHEDEGALRAKHEGLKDSLRRHGVPDSKMQINEGFIPSFGRALIGVGPGRPMQLPEEMQERQRREAEAKTSDALVTIAEGVKAQLEKK